MMVLEKYETEDAIYIRSKPIPTSIAQKFKPENLQKALNIVKTGKVNISLAAKKFKVPKQVIQHNLDNPKDGKQKIYTDDTIRRHANVIICKTYAKYQKEFGPSSRLHTMSTRITVTGAEKLDGIEFLRSLRSNQNGIHTNLCGLPSKYFQQEEDEERFIRTILDRLKENRPLNGPQMISAAKAIVDEKGYDVGMPSRPWVYNIKSRYEPLFYGDQIQIKIEVLEDKEVSKGVSYEDSILPREMLPKVAKSVKK